MGVNVTQRTWQIKQFLYLVPKITENRKMLCKHHLLLAGSCDAIHQTGISSPKNQLHKSRHLQYPPWLEPQASKV